MKIRTNTLSLMIAIAFLCMALSGKVYAAHPYLSISAENGTTPWVYRSDTDQMNGTISKTASVAPTEGFYPKFPYEDSYATLNINGTGKGGLMIYFAVSAGQIISGNEEHGSVRVKFDNDPAESYIVKNYSDDATATTIFFSEKDKFLKRLKTSKTVLIEVSFYDAPTEQIKFNTEGLVWE